MKEQDILDYVNDILVSIQDVEEFTAGITFEEFLNDRKTTKAVIRSLEVLGEASKKISDDFKDQYPQIPWKRMTGMRDKLIHEYFGVDLEIVWNVAKEELPPIKPYFIQLVKEIENKKWP
jgi:uncharacterized protein with HEPN domain